ncbi:hypothetical protein ILUMI_05262 [Ignelater luminosus]|uniref:Transcription termination factor 5, mitochondrial n=1 Tax=Ignelater luminosus TaxID=2038154 RepID=A0A8K0DDA3_IGNLU|nr:hypothetical protein ILUMI_05262 [Ignelater luminosus]
MLINKFVVLLNKNSNLFICKRLNWTASNSRLFSYLFDIPIDTFRKYKRDMKIPPLNENRIRATAALCEDLKIPKDDWLKYPILVKELAVTLEQHYMQLREGGFTNVDAEILSNYRKCVRKRISFLKKLNLIPQHTDVAENFTSHLMPKPDFSISDLTDENTFETIHHSILTRYLMWRFKASEDIIEKFCRVYALSKIKSFENLSENFAIAEDLGFPPQKLLKYGYLLTVNPKHTKRVLSEMPIIAGVDIRKAMRIHPKLIGVRLEKYTEMYDYLNKQNISDESIQKCMDIFTISMQILKCRLEEIKSIPELNILINSPYFLELIIHHNEARSRLTFLQQIKLKCATTGLLCSKVDNFHSHVRESRDHNTISEILFLLKTLLQADGNKLEMNLRKHCYFKNIPLVDIEKSCKLLKKLKFSNKSITEVIQVVLYPCEKIEKAFAELKKVNHVPPRRISQIEKLNLILYFMEKEHHFTGNGVWKDDEQKF